MLFTHLEPVYCAAVDERGEHSESVPERVPDGREGEDEMEVPSYPLYKLVVHVEWGDLYTGVLQLSYHLHLYKQTE